MVVCDIPSNTAFTAPTQMASDISEGLFFDLVNSEEVETAHKIETAGARSRTRHLI